MSWFGSWVVAKKKKKEDHATYSISPLKQFFPYTPTLLIPKFVCVFSKSFESTWWGQYVHIYEAVFCIIGVFEILNHRKKLLFLLKGPSKFNLFTHLVSELTFILK